MEVTKYFLLVKPFNCLWSVLSFPLVCSVLLWSNKCNDDDNAEITPFTPGWNLHMSETPSHQRQDAWPTNCTPKNDHVSGFFFFFFYISGTPHAKHIRACFELWGRPFRSSLFASFFLPLGFCYERNSIHTALLSHFISLVHLAHHLFFIQPGMVAGFT